MKVALVHPRYRPDGGAEKAVLCTLQALLHKEMQVKVISRSWSEQGGDVEVIQCNPFYVGRLWREWSFVRKAGKLLADMDMDIVQSQVRLPGCDIYRAGGGVHREWLRQRARISGPLRRFLTRFSAFHRYKTRAESRLYENPHLKAVICNSRMVGKEIEDYFKLPSEKIHVIYNAVDLDRFAPQNTTEERKQVRRRLKASHNQTVFLFVGSGFERKGLAALLQAMAELPEDCLLMVVGKDKQLGRFIRQSKRLGISRRVFFLGMQRDVSSFYAAADVFVLPTLYDAFANTVLEAMAASLPVVTSYKCGAVDLIENGRNGFLCDALDTARIAECLERLRNPDLRAAVGQAGRDTVEEFTVERMSYSLYELYEKILA